MVQHPNTHTPDVQPVMINQPTQHAHPTEPIVVNPDYPTATNSDSRSQSNSSQTTNINIITDGRPLGANKGDTIKTIQLVIQLGESSTV